MEFRFYRLRFHFTARDTIHFPTGKPGNILRGAFGTIFRQLACLPGCDDAKTCSVRHTCAYARTFEPASLGEGPSGLADWPRPFVFRASHLDGRTVRPRDHFHFDVHLFQLEGPTIAFFALTFAQLAIEGLGPGRGRAALTAMDQLDLAGARLARLFDGEKFCGPAEVEPSSVPLNGNSAPVSRIQVRFLTPTELKAAHQIVPRPEFGVLMNRIRDRLSTLSALYGKGPLPLDYAEFGERASQVEMTSCKLADVHVMRLSTRTGQTHPLDGFVGTAEYNGELTEFVPYLEAAHFSGVGRQTTWGKGEILVTGRENR